MGVPESPPGIYDAPQCDTCVRVPAHGVVFEPIAGLGSGRYRMRLLCEACAKNLGLA